MAARDPNKPRRSEKDRNGSHDNEGTGTATNHVFSKERRDAFCAYIAEHGRRAEACIKIGVSRTTVQKYLNEDAEFKLAFEDAMAQFRDSLIKELTRRAVNGVPVPVYFKGVRVDKDGEMRQFSDTLLLALVRRHCPEFREKVEATNVNLNADAGLADLEKLSPEQRTKLRELLDVEPQAADPEVP